ncbi:hypothetical protein SBRCBS47491_009901 [Sporothrix bragantina]|uniref:Zn(2)-C6 fungal-type domain-containing protein n=1 Tax=Sporothrix bragantina TaxID=671064 RepID=A0ABP0CYK1_9PEZI
MVHSRVSRRAQACARCRLRKVHCDARPSGCSLCTEAGVACVALLNAATREAVPRSIAQFLETQIADRERERGRLARTTELQTASRLPSRTRGTSRATATGSTSAPLVANTLLASITPTFLGLSAAVPLARCVVAGTRLPSAREAMGGGDRGRDRGSDRRGSNGHSPTSTSTMHTPPQQMSGTSTENKGVPSSPGSSLASIPVHVADFLFDNYITRVMPQYPIHYTPDLVAMHRAVFHPEEVLQDCSVYTGNPTYAAYTLNLIMAISLSTAARSKQARANAIASGLFARAMEQLPGVLTNDLRGLQALVLLTQYTFLSPGVANFWLLTGFISQACIDLGLQHDLPETPGERPDYLLRDMRRRVFWCAWEMEVAVCGALLRPITLLRRNVTTAFPSVLDDSAVTAAAAAGIDPDTISSDEAQGKEDSRADSGRPVKFTSHCIWRYREVECDIVPVLFHGEPLPASYTSLKSWMDHQEHTILAWKAGIHDRAARNTDIAAQSLWDEMQLYADIACDYILVTLFRPCPRLPQPPVENLLKAFAAAVGVADGSWQQANLSFGNSKYVFHACYHSFSAAIAFLQALQRIKPAIAAAYTWAQVEANMQAFSRFFATVAERWPAASRCLEEYERLLAPIKREYAEFLVQQAQAIQEAAAREFVASVDKDIGSDINMNAIPDFDLDEALRLGTFFNASALELEASGSTGGYGGISGFAHTHGGAFVAMDWNAEFSFGVEP